MGKKNVRVDIPVGQVDATVRLAEAITERHDTLVLGTGSPLDGLLDMPGFLILTNQIKASRTPAVNDGRQKEAWNAQALTVIGIAPGQNLQVPNTVYAHINKIHKFMKFHFRGNEEQAQLWGFDVVVSESKGRRNVNFNIPYHSPFGLLELSGNILSKHTTDGPATIFPAALFDMADLTAKHNLAIQLREDAETKDAASQAGNELARNLCGYGEGQTSETPGTLYYAITQVRDLLLVAYEGNEEQLTTFGFNVVVSTAQSPTPGNGGGEPPTPTPTPTEYDLAPGQTVVLLNDVTATTDVMLSITTGPVLLCVGPEGTMPCIDNGSSVKLESGTNFDGTLADLGLGGGAFFKASNQGASPVKFLFVAA